MLWILSGAPHSGKKSFRDLLITEYGFRAIFKYTGSDNMGDTIDVQDVNTRGQEINFKIAHRDLYLREPENKINKILNSIIAGTASLKDLKKELGDHNIIYSRLDKGSTGEKFYYMKEQDVVEAAFSVDEHFILVCTDFKAIEKIKAACIRCQKDVSLYSGRYIGKNYEIKTMYLFGFVNDGESNVKVTNKYIKNLFNGGAKKFDYVFTNLTSLEDMFDNFKKQWESLVMRHWDISQRDTIPAPIKLHTELENSKKIMSGIFFAKPFSKNQLDRGRYIYDAVNHIAALIAKAFPLKEVYTEETTYEFGDLDEPDPIQIVQYDAKINDAITKRVKGDIEDANLIVVDLSDYQNESHCYNPNCCWELGYARAFNKKIILLVESNTGLKKLSDEGDIVECKYSFSEDNFSIMTTHKMPEVINMSCDTKYAQFTLKRSDSVWKYEVSSASESTGYCVDKVLREYFIRLQKAMKNRIRHQYYSDLHNNGGKY